MHERLKELRKVLGLSQNEFSDRILVGSSTLAMWELGSRKIKDIHISKICSEFNVNEEWFRTGEGEMFNHDEDADIAKLAREFSLSRFGQAAIKGYLHLNDSDKAAIGSYIKAVAKEYEMTEDLQHNEVTAISEGRTDELDPDIKKELDSYRQELEIEKSIRMSSASRDGEKIS
jgi:transcriptional regulator with XRE-family HTH domain